MPADNLDRLRAELDSLSHERVVMDVLTRDLIRDSKLAPTSRRQPSEAPKSKVSDLIDPIVVPEYDGEHLTSAARLLERNMSDMLIGREKRKDALNRGLSVRNASLGFVVPGAKAGIPEELAGIITQPSAIPSRRARRSHKNVGNDVIYSLLSEEIQHRNTVLKNELASVQTKLNDLSKKRNIRSRNWSKEQLGGLMDVVISKYISKIEKQPQPVTASTSNRLTERPNIREVEVNTKTPEPYFPVNHREEATPISSDIPPAVLSGYRVMVARKGAFQPANEYIIPTESEPQAPEEEQISESADDVSEAALLGAQLAGVDGEFVLEGRSDGVRWVQYSDKFARPAEIGVLIDSVSERDPAVVVINSERLLIGDEEHRPRRELKQHSAKPLQRETAVTISMENEEGNVVEESAANKLFPRIPWPILSNVQPLKKAEEDSQISPKAAEVMAAEEEVVSAPQPIEPINETLPVSQSDRVSQVLELLQAIVASNESTLKSNHELILHWVTENSSQTKTEPPDVIQPSLLQFYSPLTRVGIRVFIEEFGRRSPFPNQESCSRRLQRGVVFNAVVSDKEFSKILRTDSRYENLDPSSVYEMINDAGAADAYINLSDLVNILENLSEDKALVKMQGGNVIEVANQPTAAEIASLLANAVSDIAAAISSTKPAEPAPPNLNFIEALVKNGVNDGILKALELARQQQLSPKEMMPSPQELESADDQSFITYRGSFDESDTLSSVGDVETTTRPRHGLLHSRRIGLGRDGADVVSRDRLESEVAVQHLRDRQNSESSPISSSSSSLPNPKSKHSKKVHEGRTSSSSSEVSSDRIKKEFPTSSKRQSKAQWDMNGRKLRPSSLVPPLLTSKKAGCEFTRAAQDLTEDSTISEDRGGSSFSSANESRAALRYRSYTDADEDSFDQILSMGSEASQIGTMLKEAPRERSGALNEERTSVSSESSSSDGSSVQRKVVAALKLSKHVRLR